MHELATRADGRTAIAYLGDTPWHGLGQVMRPGMTIDEWRREAGMDFSIERAPIQYETAQGVRSDRRYVSLYRSDTLQPLSVVSTRYQVVQPGSVVEFFAGLAESAGLELNTMGVLFNGARYWALAKVRDEMRISLDGDSVEPYLLLATACDGSMATVGLWTSVRVVCNNTLSLSGVYKSGEAKGLVRISHRTAFRPDEVKKELGLDQLRERWTAFSSACEVLAGVKICSSYAERFARGLLSAQGGLIEYQSDRREPSGLDRVMALFQGEALGSEFDAAKGTAWGLLNAVTQYADWEGRARTADRRLADAFFGRMSNLKTQAMRDLLAIA